jgi:hypothetical protein
MQYPRGYPLPFFLTLKSGDTQALDLLASPKAITVSLKRIFVIGLDVSKVKWEKDDPVEDTVGVGRCWVTSAESREGCVRTLRGEIFVHRKLLPNFSFPRIQLKVF